MQLIFHSRFPSNYISDLKLSRSVSYKASMMEMIMLKLKTQIPNLFPV